MSSPDCLKVLIVEDDRDVCDNLQDILELDDHRVTLAHTGADALAQAARAKVDVILLDWKLPDTIALQLMPRLKQTAPQAVVIIVTGHGDLDSAIASLRQGAVDYLLKPINPEALRNHLRRIAEQRKLARAKARSERAFRNLVETAPCAIVILRADGTTVYFSSFTEKLTGLAWQNVLGKNFFEIALPPQERAEFSEKIKQILTVDAVKDFSGTLLSLDGRHKQILWKLEFLEDFEDAPAVLAFGQDLTDYQSAMERLVQSERLAAIGEAMTGLVHESRNALARSQANLRRLARRLQGEQELLELIAQAQRAQEDISRQFEEVRAYAAPLKLNRAVASLRELFEEAWDQISAERELRDAELTIRSSEINAKCGGDRFLLVNAIRNIFENSLAATDGTVRIQVDFANTDLDNRSAVEVSIRDHGPGLSPEAAERALDAFYTTKTRGTGLGLAIVKRIIESHGGRIALANADVSSGTGTIVSLIIPEVHP